MDKQFLHMQKIAGLITESEYKQKMTENQNKGTRYFIVVNFEGQSDELGNMHGIKASDKNDFVQKFKSMFNDDINAPQQSYTFYEVPNEEKMNKIEQISDKWEGGEDTDETMYLQNIADKAKSFDEIYS
jgi:hypothetical protein